MQLKEYQENKINILEEQINELLNLPENRTCIFKAPTGSGKTLMVAETLKRLVKNRHDGKQLSFVWIAPRMLHGQSKEKLEKFYENTRTLECSTIEDLQDNQIQENEILFLNWESLNKKNNILTIENEQDKNITKIIENTKEEGREIILIIDESHYSAQTETARRLIQDISPKITLEVSATPHLVQAGDEVPRIVEVTFKEVVDEGMIKKEVLINSEIDKEKVTKDSSDSLVIKAALSKRKQLLEIFKKEKSNINPLLLIQLPDSKKGVLDKKEDIIKKLKDEFAITEENGKLAIWLSETKTPNLANIEKEDNETEVLIFKQAIAIGWDCPRAAILVLFRDWKSITFSIQTVGRIMRMPEHKHYENENLNKGYVYTNLDDLSIAEGLAKDYITRFEAKRKNNIYSEVKLESYYIKRQREKTRLSGAFREIFFEIAIKNKFASEIKLKPNLVNEIMLNGKIEKIDKIIEHVYKENVLKVKHAEAEIQYIFDLFIRDNCRPFAPVDSQRIIKSTIYKFFEKRIKIRDESLIQKILLTPENREIFIRNLEEAKEKYSKEISEKIADAEVQISHNWEVPEEVSYSEKNKEVKVRKSIMHPYYTRNPSTPEKDFIDYLEQSKKVVWWYKNGESEKKYFGVIYQDKTGKHGFYVDFIFKLENGQIGLFDTKSGRTAEDAGPRAEALAKYIQEQNKKGRKLIGGILIKPKNSKIWKYNADLKYEYNENDLSNWKYLDL